MPDGVYVPALYLVRHGEPTLAGVLLGRSDPPLSPNGRAQIEALHVDAGVFFTSTLRRSVESAEICGRGSRIVALSDLDEIALGDWDGLSWAEIERGWPELAARKLQDWFGVTAPGGEPWKDFTDRVDKGIDRILASRTAVAVVAHLTVNAWIAHRLAGSDPLSFQQKYAECYIYVF